MPALPPIVHSPVPLRTELLPGESILSFLSRITELNRYDSVRWLFQGYRDLNFDSGRWSSELVFLLTTISGLDPETFSKSCYRVHDQPGRLEDQRHFLSTRFPSLLLRSRFQRYCPHCLQEDGFNPAIFDLVAIDVCPRHAVRLHDRCPSCTKPITWGRPGVNTCPACRYDLRSAPIIRVSHSATQATAAIASRAGVVHAPRIPTPFWPAEADHLDLGESIELLAILARLGTDHRQQRYFLTFPANEAHVVLQTGYSYLLDWPDGFFRCLDRIADRSTQDSRTKESRHKLFGFARVYGEFYRRIAAAKNEPFLVLKEGFARYSVLQDKTPITGRRDGAVFTAQDIENRPLITPKEASKILQVGTYAVRALLHAGAFATTTKIVGVRERIFISREQVEALAKGGPPVTKAETARILGISPDKVDNLIRHGVLTPLVGPQICGSMHYMFARRDIKGLITRIRIKASPDSASAANTRFTAVLLGVEFLHLSAKPVFDAIESKALLPRGIDNGAVGLAQLLFNKHEVACFLHLRHDIELGDTVGLTCLRVSHILRIETMAVRWLVEMQLLQPGAGAQQTNLKISRQSLDRFQADYITVSEVLQTHRTKYRFIVRALAKAGISPVRECDGYAAIHVYDRVTVSRLDISALVRTVGRRAGRSGAEYKRLWKADRRTQGLPIS